jgi:hypothetical protein
MPPFTLEAEALGLRFDLRFKYPGLLSGKDFCKFFSRELSVTHKQGFKTVRGNHMAATSIHTGDNISAGDDVLSAHSEFGHETPRLTISTVGMEDERRNLVLNEMDDLTAGSYEYQFQSEESVSLLLASMRPKLQRPRIYVCILESIGSLMAFGL